MNERSLAKVPLIIVGTMKISVQKIPPCHKIHKKARVFDEIMLIIVIFIAHKEKVLFEFYAVLYFPLS